MDMRYLIAALVASLSVACTVPVVDAPPPAATVVSPVPADPMPAQVAVPHYRATCITGAGDRITTCADPGGPASFTIDVGGLAVPCNELPAATCAEDLGTDFIAPLCLVDVGGEMLRGVCVRVPVT